MQLEKIIIIAHKMHFPFSKCEQIRSAMFCGYSTPKPGEKIYIPRICEHRWFSIEYLSVISFFSIIMVLQTIVRGCLTIFVNHCPIRISVLKTNIII